MNKGISLSFDFLDKYVRFSKPDYLQVYLYIKSETERGKGFPDADSIAKALDIPSVKAEFILEYWASRGEIEFDGTSYHMPKASIAISDVPSHDTTSVSAAKPVEKTASASTHMRSVRPSYSQKEISAVSDSDKQISGMFYQAETILKKALTVSETELLFSFHDWLGLPVEVILMLLSYASKKGKTTKRYLETVAIDWADKGIDSFEAAEAYISELEASDNAEAKIRSILGIHNRALTSTERKYIKLWSAELKAPSELISLAYDRTVTYTGKLSWSYMDKLLQSWLANGFSTVQEVESADEEFYKNSTVKKTASNKSKNKFNNYDDENLTDYSDINSQLLDAILDD